jgi:hypothetical protein
MVSRLSEWRRAQAEGEEYTLPSGMVMRLRRVGLLDLAMGGKIPPPLVGLVDTLLQREEVKLTLEEFERYGEVTALVVKAAAVDPPVADKADDEHLGLDELPMTDRLSIFSWANVGVKPLRPSRPEAVESAGGGQ